MRDLEHEVRRGDCLDPVVGLASLPADLRGPARAADMRWKERAAS